MKNLILFFSSLVIFGSTAFSQETSPHKIEAIHIPVPIQSGSPVIANEVPKEGTYQIVFKNGTTQHPIDNQILFQVNHLRAYENVIIIYVDQNTQINVLPYEVIYDPNFIPVPTYIFE
jgi:hypothetical protein